MNFENNGNEQNYSVNNNVNTQSYSTSNTGYEQTYSVNNSTNNNGKKFNFKFFPKLKFQPHHKGVVF